MNPRALVKKVIPKSIFRAVEPYGHWAEAVIAQNKYGFPAKDMKVIGVTGTDGKTTTCSLIASVLRAGGYKVGVITTAYIDYGDGKGEQVNPTQLTTGNVFVLSQLITRIKANDVDWLVLEVSSHALHQHRTWGIPFSLAVLTNMSPEHLDYHGTFENYRKAKQLLFKQCKQNRNGLQTGIINTDDAVADYFITDSKNALTYGVKHGDLRATNVQPSLAGNSFTVKIDGKIQDFHTQLIGEFNVYNALAAIGVGNAIGMDVDNIAHGVSALPFVSGRMMPIKAGQPFEVLIDYAVTPGALENVLTTVRHLAGKGRVHVVFGATGDRDTQKRPAMGKVTTELADYVYLTDDETYTEDAANIRAAVMSGVSKQHRSKVAEFDNREEAIKTALKAAKKGDVIVIAGIGHQSTRNMGGKKVAWSDIDITKRLLKGLK
jgi:UDP-N-acetylmuramoyl-L-alanyl-D-glutamate--2,6-diaminopimelate ligase